MACPLCGKKVAFGKGVKISITAPRLRKCKLLNVDKYDHRLYVCYDHFDPKDHVIKKGKIVGLVKGATPITNLKKDMPDETKSREEIEEAQLNVLDLISVEKVIINSEISYDYTFESNKFTLSSKKRRIMQ